MTRVARKVPGDPGRRVQTVQPRHENVQEDDIGAMGPGQANRLTAIARFGNNLDVAERLQERSDAGPEQSVIVRE